MDRFKHIHSHAHTHIHTHLPDAKDTNNHAIHVTARCCIQQHIHAAHVLRVQRELYTIIFTYRTLIHMVTCIDTSIHTDLQTYRQKYMQTYIHTWVHTCIHTNLIVYTYIRTHACMIAFVQTDMYQHINTYVHTSSCTYIMYVMNYLSIHPSFLPSFPFSFLSQSILCTAPRSWPPHAHTAHYREPP